MTVEVIRVNDRLMAVRVPLKNVMVFVLAAYERTHRVKQCLWQRHPLKGKTEMCSLDDCKTEM